MGAQHVILFALLIFNGHIYLPVYQPVTAPSLCTQYGTIHHHKYLGTRTAYYGNTTATFQLELLVAGDVNPNPGPQTTVNNVVDKPNTNHQVITYDSKQLRAFNKYTAQKTQPLPTSLLNHLKVLGINATDTNHYPGSCKDSRSKRRGKRGGRRKPLNLILSHERRAGTHMHKKIPVHVNMRDSHSFPLHSVDQQHRSRTLTTIPLVRNSVSVNRQNP